MNAPPLIGAAVSAVAAGAVAAFQETVGDPGARRPIEEIISIITQVSLLFGVIGGIVTPLFLAWLATKV